MREGGWTTNSAWVSVVSERPVQHGAFDSDRGRSLMAPPLQGGIGPAFRCPSGVYQGRSRSVFA